MPKKSSQNRKRRGKKEGSVFQMPNGKWRAQISIQGLNGKRKRVTRTGDSKEHAVLLLSELRSERPSFVNSGSSSSVSVADYLQSWLSSQVESKAAATYSSYRQMIKNHISPCLGSIRLSDLFDDHINLWIKEMESKKVGKATQKTAYKVLKASITYACKRGILTKNPLSFVSAPKNTRETIYPFSVSETMRILKHVKGDPLEAVYHLGLKTGVRQGEIFGLQWQDVDHEARQISIKRVVSLVDGKLYIKEPKTTRSRRIVALPQLTLDAFPQKGTHKRTDHVFVSQTGKLIRRSSFGTYQWSRVLKKLNLEHRGFHHTRHTAATLMLRAGAPVHVVSGQLGHSSPSITLDVYAHYIPEDRESAVSAVERALRDG